MMSRLHEIWDTEGHAEWLERVWGRPDIKKGRHWLLLKSIAKLVRYSPMLDVGMGMGHFLLTMRDVNSEIEYSGFDISVEMLNKAKQFFPGDAERFSVGDVYDLSKFEKFNSVVCIDVFIHLPEIEVPIQQCWSLAKKEFVFTMRPSTTGFLVRKPHSGRIALPEGKKLIVRGDKMTTTINAIGMLKDVAKIEVFHFDARSVIFRLTRGHVKYDHKRGVWVYP